MPKILVVEDDPAFLDIVVDSLSAADYDVHALVSGLEGLSNLLANSYDLAIVDWDLPGMSGFEICAKFREQGGATPMLFLTGKAHVDNKEAAFEAGADDYLTKPFSLRELMLRVAALLKRPKVYVGNVLREGDLELNLKAFTAHLDGQEIQLTGKEFALLELFMRHPNQVFSLDDILDRIWKLDGEMSNQTVKSCINRLRKKLNDPSLIANVRGEGYRLRLDR